MKAKMLLNKKNQLKNRVMHVGELRGVDLVVVVSSALGSTCPAALWPPPWVRTAAQRPGPEGRARRGGDDGGAREAAGRRRRPVLAGAWWCCGGAAEACVWMWCL